jgi:hypothetical protein
MYRETYQAPCDVRNPLGTRESRRYTPPAQWLANFDEVCKGALPIVRLVWRGHLGCSTRQAAGAAHTASPSPSITIS